MPDPIVLSSTTSYECRACGLVFDFREWFSRDGSEPTTTSGSRECPACAAGVARVDFERGRAARERFDAGLMMPTGEAERAIAYLTGHELSPSTLHLLALERLAQAPDWIDADERATLVEEIVNTYEQGGGTDE